MKLPTREECFKLLEKYGILPNILKHSLLVNKIAVYLAKKLKHKGIDIDIDVVDRASLLHDIGKSVLIRNNPEKANSIEDNHHIVGEEILIKEGYPEIARIVRLHSLKEIKNLSTWEEKVLQYADLRVKHDKIVSLRERLDDLYRRYNVPEEKRVDEEIVFSLEKEIFDIIQENPNILKKVIK
ncbi:MAG: HD domain-containing protein [Nanoarchaeota archaeon]|nr:HD domain-containing protein [Nanoarchaeota archaeon]